MLNQATHLQLTPGLFRGPVATTDESRAFDREFRQYYVERALPVTRVALALLFVFYFVVGALDAALMPLAFVENAMPVRIFAMVIPPAAALGGTFLFRKRPWLPYLIAAVVFVVGLSAVLVGVIATRTGAEMEFWAVTYTTFNAYLVLGLTLRQSAVVGWLIFFAYLAVGIAQGAPLAALTYGGLVLGFANLAGTYVSYLLERNARQIFDNKRELIRLARTDDLTGLFNRRTFDEHLRKVWKQARRDKTRIAVIVADIDHFKLYNDCYGHQKGDECIKDVADVLANSVDRPLDLVARYGGEEFVIVLYDPTESFLESFVRSLCKKVVDLDIDHKAAEDVATLTLSIGAAITDASGSVTGEQLIRQADDALYEAKSQGRNQAIVYKTEWGQQTTANLAAVLL